MDYKSKYLKYKKKYFDLVGGVVVQHNLDVLNTEFDVLFKEYNAKVKKYQNEIKNEQLKFKKDCNERSYSDGGRKRKKDLTAKIAEIKDKLDKLKNNYNSVKKELNAKILVATEAKKQKDAKA